MNEKEIAEIRRRFRQEKSNITHILGCYVNEQREIVSQFDQSVAMMTEEESENFFSILKRTLSGTLGKNLIDIEFSNQQVIDSQEHKLLMELRSSSLKNSDAVAELYQQIISSLIIEGSYVILLAYDAYDIPHRSKDGETQLDASSEVFSYYICSICPVKLAKPALSYHPTENEFHSRPKDWILSPPELGFMFPAFDDRCTNIYNALYYSRNAAENHDELVDSIFKTDIQIPAQEQKEIFQSILCESLEEECNLEVVQAVQDQLRGMIEEHKERKEEEPLLISKRVVKRVLESCEVSAPKVEVFDEKFDSEFGEGASLSPRNLVDIKQIDVETPCVKIKIDAERGDVIETKIIDGIKYILIRADEGVEVNGINISIRNQTHE